MEGGDHEEDLLLNPAHALVCSYGENKEMANLFVDWLIRPGGGQEVIKSFAVNNKILYSRAPAIGDTDAQADERSGVTESFGAFPDRTGSK